jgi:hypothetical protein
MKRVASIGNHIKNNSYSYTGKGNFEAIVKENKELILSWLEELVPLKTQIDRLNEQENVEFQKRNYIRILTKYFEEEYTLFVSVNILVRDTEYIKNFYKSSNSLRGLYNQLINQKYLKYPGRSEKYIEFDMFKMYIDTYKDDLEIYFDDSVGKTSEVKTEDKKESKKTNWTKLLLGEK